MSICFWNIQVATFNLWEFVLLIDETILLSPHWYKLEITFSLFPWQPLSGRSGWSTGTVVGLGESRCISTLSGEQCVMMAGAWTMPQWCATSRAVELLSVPQEVPALARVMETSGWMMLNVLEVRAIWQTAVTRELEHMIVVIARMLVLSAQVRDS